MKIVTIIGARPQFVKAAAVSRMLANCEEIKEILVHTGQHFDHNMSTLFFEELAIPAPHYHLDVHSLKHGAMIGRMMEKLEELLLLEKPDWVLVYGDTNSTLAGALSAKKLCIKVAHIEAGLRSFNMAMPEEINRIITDRISDVLFCPTDTAVANLINEQFEKFDCQIVKCGDVMLDAAMYYAQKARKPKKNIPDTYILCTVHRAETTDNLNLLAAVFTALAEISLEIPIVIPLHPRTRQQLAALSIDFQQYRIVFIEPTSYLEMLWLLQNCTLVMTDSGGLQKEAYFFNKYCVTLRNETEWTELVERQYNILAGHNPQQIKDAVKYLLSQQTSFCSMPLYGTGNAASEIVNILIKK